MKGVALEIAESLRLGRSDWETLDLVTAGGVRRELGTWLISEVRGKGPDLRFLTAPPVSSGASAPPIPNQGYSSQPQKKIGIFVGAALVVVLGLVGFVALIASSPSGIKVNGKEMSVGETLATVHDLERIATAYGDGDEKALENLPEAQTSAGRHMVNLLREQTQINKAFEEGLANVSPDDIVSAERLSTAKGRSKSRSELRLFRDTSLGWSRSEKNWQERYDKFLRSLGSTDTIESLDSGKMLPAILEFGEASRNLSDTMLAIVDFADKAKPAMEDGKIVFEDEDYDKMMALSEKEENAAQAYNKVLQKMIKAAK